MIATGHQPNYLPYIGFFHKIVHADVYIIVDNVQFVKRGPFGWIHRNKIRTEKGWEWLTVPVLTKGKFHQTILETQIDNTLPWRRKHWKALEWNYGKAPFFRRYADIFNEIYSQNWASLCTLNCAIIEKILHLLDVHIPIYKTSELGITEKATRLIIEMCKKIGADSYLSGVHGKDYLDEAVFSTSGIQLRYQEFQHPAYPQCYPGDFMPNLSIVDMLFNCGDESIKLLKHKP